MTQLITVNGVRGYIDESGTAHLSLEDVSRGLGFVQQKNGSSYVRWERVNGHLTEMGFPQLVGKEFVPENVFYRLAMKGENETAVSFQIMVADEILPSIRKTGSYSIQHQLPQTMIEAVESYLIEMKKNVQLESEKQQLAIENTAQKQQLKEQETPIAIYNLAIAAKNTMSMQEAAKALGTGRTRMYDFLREESIVMKGSTLPYQRFIDSGYFKVTERPRASGDTIVNDPATRVTAKGFDYIARLMQKRQGA